jgi:hypothetical protein
LDVWEASESVDGEMVICFEPPYAATLAIVDYIRKRRCRLKAKYPVKHFDVIRVCSGWPWRTECRMVQQSLDLTTFSTRTHALWARNQRPKTGAVYISDKKYLVHHWTKRLERVLSLNWWRHLLPTSGVKWRRRVSSLFETYHPRVI